MSSPAIDPTPVNFVSFIGHYADLQHVDLTWETSSEVDAAGFIVYRSLDNQNWIQANDQLIPAQGVGGAGAVYNFSDNLPKQRVYQRWYYKVEEIDSSGQRVAQANCEVSR